MTEIDAGPQARLTTEVAALESSMKGHMARLTALQAELEKLRQEEAETIAEYVSAKQIIELNNRLMNAYDSLSGGAVERGPRRGPQDVRPGAHPRAARGHRCQAPGSAVRAARTGDGRRGFARGGSWRRGALEREGGAPMSTASEHEAAPPAASTPAEPSTGAPPPERPQI